MAALNDMLREVGATFIMPFRFVKSGAKRTSHYLIFVSKNFLGYKIMRDVMWKASSCRDPDGIASFEHAEQQQFFVIDGRSIEALAKSLVNDLAGTTMTFEEVFERHSPGRLYVLSNYREALLRLEANGDVGTSPPADQRRPYKGRPSLREDVRVTFARLPGTGAKIEASRSTAARRATGLPPSASARPTA